MDKYQNKEIRGRILKILQVNYPDPAGDHLISELLTDAQYNVTPEDVKKHLDYLEGKEYIKTERVNMKGLGIARILSKLTPKGIDLLEGNIDEDAGVEVN